MDRPVGARGLNEPLAAVDAAHRHKSYQSHHTSYHGDPPDYSAQMGDSSSAYLGSTTASYKELKEAWIADQTGSSVHTVNLLAIAVLSTYALWAVLRAKSIRFVRSQHRRQPQELGNPILTSLVFAAAKLSDWQLEFAILIVPAVCAHTVLGTHLLLTDAALITAVVLLIFSGPSLSQTPPSVREKKKKQHWSKKYSDDEDEGFEADARTNSQDTLADLPRPANLSFAESDLPFRVSIDSAADAAHAAAAPPNFYDGPGSRSFRSAADLTIDTSMSAAPQSPLLSSANSTFASRSSEGGLLSPEMASTSAFPSPTKRSADLTALKTTPMQLLHSRDGSDEQSVVSPSSAMSPLARSVVDPWSKGKQPSVDHSMQGVDDAAPPQEQPYTSISTGSKDASDRSMFVRPQPFLTVYRAHMMLVTVISILAVDFPAFPRFMSKCESWGTSWMDMGVGSFVFSLGIISALPFLKSPSNRFRPLKQQIVSDFKKSLPLLLLGSVRVIMVKGVEYPEHVTEYGVHWNFFITLALLPFAATLSRPFAKYIRYSVLGLGLTFGHQIMLYTTSWQSWALGDIQRDTLLRQNKEGITSMVGYLAIFYIGLDLGHYVLPLDPYFAYRKLRRGRSKPKTDKLAMVLASLAILWWMGFAMSYALGLRTSRRLANLPYVLWVAAFNTSFLLSYVLIYLWILQPVEQQEEKQARGNADTDPVTPKILADLNRHSLTVFLAANLLTGLVNLTTQTMYTRDSIAVLILLAYTGACCGLARFMTARGTRLKF